ncbi:EpsG family protein [Bacteroidales bacterium OttesenSCG-928-K03]|nr:EpsG family protein [Odoribacter sp. OttesenSCG-928-L07]MDL2239383.1 EpsG family protein [Bacteroidales bacterium OttesenSCG-928-L14]MDL2242726.1 EpsG family protein [Bacteroidales bacterium OttesenSCG-928-K03]
MIQSILIYTLLLGVMMLFFYSASYNNKSFKSYQILIPLLLFSIVFGMRYDVGVDYISYLEAYLWKEDFSKNEFLFSLITNLSNYLNLHFVIYFSILAFIQVFFFFYAFKKEVYLFPLLIFFLFTNGEIMSWMNIIRQSLAMCIWIYSIKYIEQKALWRYLFLGLIAYFFHRSAIILFIFYPLLRNGRDYFKNIPLQLILLASALIIKELFFSLIMNFIDFIDFYLSLLGTDMYERSYNIDGLLESFTTSSGTGLAYIWKLVINVVIILFSVKLKKYYNSRWFNIVYFFFFMGLITFYIFPEGAISFTRPFRYFYIFQSIMLAYFIYYLSKSNSLNNRILMIVIIISFLGIFYLNQITSDENSHLWYQFFFQHKVNMY